MRKIFGTAAVIILVAIPAIYFLYVYQFNVGFSPPTVPVDEPIVHIGNVPIRVEVADTNALRTKGLGGRSSLGVTNGMLFIFDTSDYHKIWMKDMHIIIDVIWIDQNFTVVDITKGLRPDSFPKTFEPASPARFAIETNVHYAESFGIVVGDKVTFPPELIPEDLQAR